MRFSYELTLSQQHLRLKFNILHGGSQIIKSTIAEFGFESFSLKSDSLFELLELELFPGNQSITITRKDKYLILELISNRIIIPASVENLVMLQQLTIELQSQMADLYEPNITLEPETTNGCFEGELLFSYSTDDLYHTLSFSLGSREFCHPFKIQKPLTDIVIQKQGDKVVLCSGDMASFRPIIMEVEMLSSLIRINNNFRDQQNHIYLPINKHNTNTFNKIKGLLESELDL